MAAKRKLTLQVQKKFCDLLKVGNTVTTACDACGIGERTFHDWMQRGQSDDSGVYRNFHAAVSRARAAAKQMLLARIRLVAQKDWKVAAWMAERLFPKEFGPVTVRELEKDQEAQQLGVKFILNSSRPLSELLNFPVAGDDPATVAELQQAVKDNIEFWEPQVKNESAGNEA